MDDLREEILEIQGVGEATADSVETVVSRHAVDRDKTIDELTKAIALFQTDRPEHAEDTIRTLREGLE